jgi:dTDP-4-dehydrorhamnose 3,5-epimerase
VPDAHVVPLTTRPTAIEGLLVVTPKQATDARGTVREVYRASAGDALPGLGPVVQVNATRTHRGGVRGLHAEDTTKLVSVVHGEAFGAWVDLRAGSATRGVVVTERLVPGLQVLVPRGVANGFQAVGDGGCEYLYCFDTEWAPGMAGQAVTPLDEDLAIDWPLPVVADDPAVLSAKDAAAPRLRDLAGWFR